MLKYFYIYSNLALTYTNDMLQIADNDYVTLTPFSRSFTYIFQTEFWSHLFGLVNIALPLTQLPVYIYCVNRQYKSAL